MTAPHEPSDDQWLRAYLGEIVVVDLDESYLVIGRLAAVDAGHLAFAQADLHDHREANCTKEVYVLETLKLGVRANRRTVSVPRHRLLAISRLDEIEP